MVDITKRTVNSPKAFNLEGTGRSTLLDKIYLGFVKNVDDLQRMGRLKVWIPELGSDPNDETSWMVVSYCSPFAGATNFYDNKNGQSYLDSQTSYGMWFVPPDLENQVIVAFLNGDSAKGVWIGCLYQQNMNHMVPGIPGDQSTATLPVGEYNKKITQTDITKPKRPIYSPLADQLTKQGLDKDTIRGVTDSGARRNSPANSVYGFLTPAGSQVVFDDNPSNAFLRFRTQSGAQVLINDSVGCIYLNSVDGKNWISMDATGKIDIYALDDITIRSQASVNIRGDLDVNIEAGRNINMRARGQIPTPLVVPNTSNPETPPTKNNGEIQIIGDSIAVGVGSKIPLGLTFANVGDNSTTILQKIKSNSGLGNQTNTILSVGSNDGNMTVLASNLAAIRTALGKSNFIWILPYASAQNNTVKTFATSKGDKYLDLNNYPSNDKIHPKDYAVVANDAQALCVAAPTVTTSTGQTVSNPSGLIAEGQPWYNVGVYKTLDEAKAGQFKYRQMADYARAHPENYTDPPGGYLAVLKFEAVADAEVRRLSGQGAPVSSSTSGSSSSSGSKTSGRMAFDKADITLAEEVPTSTTTTNTSTSGQPASDKGVDTYTLAAEFIKKNEGGFQAKAYPDPGPTWYSIGYGHNIGANELKKGLTYIDCGSAGRVPLKGQYGKDTVLTQDQAAALYGVDINSRFEPTVKSQLGGAYDVLGPYQKVALLDYCYNVGNVLDLKAKGIVQAIETKNIEQGAVIIQNSITRSPAGDNLQNRRNAEANMYRQRPDLIGTAGPSTLPDGTPESQNAFGSPLSPAGSVTGGFIKIQSQNDMHFLSGNHMFSSSAKDMHRLAGANMYDSSVGNTDRISGGYLTESIAGAWSVGVQRNINLNGARIDLNGISPGAAIPAATAIGPIGQKQTDAVVNSLGNVAAILTDTILPHLPYHEPYDNHGGRVFENLRNSTKTNGNTNLRDGEIIPGSDTPLDLYGAPKKSMPPGFYTGAGYNSQNAPIYNFGGPLPQNVLYNAAGLKLSDAGRQFIIGRENGSYRVISIGTPPYLEIGYGHTLTPEETSSQTVVIKGLSVTLTEPLTQQQINDLFDQDMTKVLTWMRPLIKAPVSQTQFDMLASLAFNIGQSNFTSSPVVKYFNEGALQKVPNSWMVHTVTVRGDVLPGLVDRRRSEVVKFVSGPIIDQITGQSTSSLAPGGGG